MVIRVIHILPDQDIQKEYKNRRRPAGINKCLLLYYDENNNVQQFLSDDNLSVLYQCFYSDYREDSCEYPTSEYYRDL
ncbi:hypothetical protein TUM12151_11720 [Morganella morganii]|nr:hypothetical protein TUM12149_30330 [Morganella morganii]GIZ29522.1 hypothetical protein TUM12150_00080 [Morganella morganii]GIZ34186.1 hypothetical protein TUM12151_11720 [Morganella morganii]